MKCKYFNDKYSSIEEFRATAEKVISIKISNRSEKIMKKKEIQKLENQLVEKAWENAQKVWIKELKEVERLNYCQAWVYKANGYCFLVSYKTIVSFIDESGNMYDVLRLVYGYTSTSAKHISKFRNKFNHVSEHTWREV